MNTPIADFINGYIDSGARRLHMPGHKGSGMLGIEKHDITEIRGADALYEADGIIAESERNASGLFGSAATFYSTEGSSQCLKAMLMLAALKGEKPLFVAARNVHKAFLYGISYLDADVEWLYGADHEENGNFNVCACRVTPESLERTLKKVRTPAAVYVTSPDYTGEILDIKGLAEVAHRYGTLLLADNAHGAYLHFLETPCHPLDLGADLCCDSAHKTLPVLTGGAYLHIAKTAPKELSRRAKYALETFGSTSPSYLILESLDLCNRYLSDKAKSRIKTAVSRLDALKKELCENGFALKGTEPLKLTVSRYSIDEKRSDLSAFEPEMLDKDMLVLMFSGESGREDFNIVKKALKPAKTLKSAENGGKGPAKSIPCPVPERKMSIRKALLSPYETMDITLAEGRTAASPSVSCPPAVPVVMPGEMISKDAIEIMDHYGITKVNVIKE